MATVFVAPINKIIEVQAGQSLMEAIKAAGIYLRASCGGHASCGDCTVKITEGAHELGSMEFAEQRLLGNVFHLTKERLSCQCFLPEHAHLSIDLTGHDQQADDALRGKMVKRRPGGMGKRGESREKKEEATTSGLPANERSGGGRRPRMFETPDPAVIPENRKPSPAPATVATPPKFPRKKFRSE